jgi:hypothetical protein
MKVISHRVSRQRISLPFRAVVMRLCAPFPRIDVSVTAQCGSRAKEAP